MVKALYLAKRDASTLRSGYRRVTKCSLTFPNSSCTPVDLSKGTFYSLFDLNKGVHIWLLTSPPATIRGLLPPFGGLFRRVSDALPDTIANDRP